ncbi:MAG: CRISPR-associated helicase Cas3' [Holophaga sp.]|nr:CRISPR-associated helicase Cas3' [Holophaga sp.]
MTTDAPGLHAGKPFPDVSGLDQPPPVSAQLWAKTGQSGTSTYHPLPLHLLDVACSADAILAREPPTTRSRMGELLGLSWEEARPWLLLVIACHDLGKASPGFQAKWPGAKPLLERAELAIPPGVDTRINHAFVSQVALGPFLFERDWPRELAFLAADAVGCHHGERAAPLTLDLLEGNRKALGNEAWNQVRRELFEALGEVFQPLGPPTRDELTGPGFMLLAGLTSFADWIGSNEAWFPFGTPQDCNDLKAWRSRRERQAHLALDAIGWGQRTPLLGAETRFATIFQMPPRPLQLAVERAVGDVTGPAILLVEAPMGEGKTEAAFYAHLELQRRFGHRGLYVALPTKATGNAMFERTLTFLRGMAPERNLDLQLLHGAARLNDAFQDLQLAAIHTPEGEGTIRAGEWFTHKKRALLSEYGVGTVDQALLAILPVRHPFVRLWGLANRVVVFDEIHAYDAYTGTLLVHLLRWLLSLGSSVILLSATLPPSIRRRLAEVVGAAPPEDDAPYPRLTIFQPGTVKQRPFAPDESRRVTVHLEGIPHDLPAMKAAMDRRLAAGGMGLVLVNTVARAQDLYCLYPEGEPLSHGGERIGKRLLDGTEVFLFHARYPADRRQLREDSTLATFGKTGAREGRKVLIATQVAEQSLDLDFDVMATDLAPIDLVLQRAGRLWRHDRPHRPVPDPCLLVAGLAGEEPPPFGQPLWWGAVYQEDLLMRTWCLLHGRQDLTLPDEIDPLVQAVYEDQVEIPEALKDRMEKSMMEGEGETFAQLGLANQAVIGRPDDASWNDPARYTKADEDEPGLHPTLIAQTRLGEPSVVAIPIQSEGFDPGSVPDRALAKRWSMQSMSLSRVQVVRKLQTAGVPSGWAKSPLLRNAFPLLLDVQGRWEGDPKVRLRDDLGLVFEQKELT